MTILNRPIPHPQVKESTVPRWRQGLLEFLILAVVVASLVLPRVIALGRFVTPDEPLWGKRAGSFFYALTNQSYSGTYQTGHPGVMAMWAGALAYQRIFPEYEKYGQIELGDTKMLEIFKKHGINPMEILANARLNMVIFGIIALLVSYFFARRLFGLFPAAFIFLMIAFDPFQIAHSRVLHHFGLLSSLTFLTVLACLGFLRTRSRLGLVVSGIAGGLSILTVSPGFILIPVVGLLFFFGLYDLEKGRMDFGWSQLGKKVVAPALIWGGLALLTFYAVWPAMWNDPVGTLQRIAEYSMSASEGEIGSAHFVEAYQAAGQEGALYLNFYPLTYLWRSTPLTLAGLLLFAASLLLSWQAGWMRREVKISLIGLGVFILMFTLVMSIGEKKFDRYLLPAYPPLSLMAALGWIAAVEMISKKFPVLQRIYLPVLVLAAAVIIQGASALRAAPYYLTYYNPLLGGLDRAPQVMSVGWGEGLNDAALYLRDIPGIKKMRVITWYPLAFNWYSHSLGFQAELEEFSWDATRETYRDYDYAVLYINQIQRNMPPAFLEAIKSLEPEHIVRIDGVEFVRIYRLQGQSTTQD